MAQKTIMHLVDDLSGEQADETIRVSLDGAHYVIDLSERNATYLREAMAPFLAAARREPGGAGTVPRRRTHGTAQGRDVTAVRTWARANGWPDTAQRGRVATDIIDAYDRAHGA